MLTAKLTLRGLINFVPDLLDSATFPEGINSERVIDALLWEGGDLELLYASPDYIKQHLPHFCAAHAYKWERLQKTLELEYNPIENYDRMETWTDSGEAASSAERSDNGSSTNAAAPFNSNELTDEMEPRERTTNVNTNEETGESSFENEHSGRTHGNIGVTTTQDMIEQERRVASFNIYRVIANDFIEEFCLQVF